LLPLTGRLPAGENAGLVSACRNGDLAAFEQLYAIHAGRMKSIAYHLLSDRSDAEDAVQETFLRIYRAMADFEGEAGFNPWMYRILINCCRDAGRKRVRQAEAPLDDTAPASSNQAPLQVALKRALCSIHPGHRMVFWLFEAEGFRHSEIAGILEIPEGTSRKWLFEAKRDLRRILKEARI